MWMLFGLIGIGVLFQNRETIQNAVEGAMGNDQFDKLFKDYGMKESVPWQWLKAIAMNESSLGRHPSVARGLVNPKDVEGSKSEDGKSWGLMQVTLTTARSMDFTATPEKLNNPEYSIGLAAKYLGQLSKMFPMIDVRYVEYVIKSYNQGPGNTRKEIAKQSPGYAQEYWERFQRNLKRVEGV